MQITDRFKSTKGFNAQVVVAKALQYWGDGTKTLATFTAGGIADGTFCFFNANTGVSLPSSAVASTVNIVAGVIRDGKARVTTPFSTATHKVDKAVYAAGVLHQAQVAAPASGTPTVGKEYGILIKDITNSNLSENATYRYSVVATASHSTYALLAAALVAKINSTSSIENSTKDLLVTAAVVNTDDITLTAKKIGQLFTVGVFEEGAVAFTTSITAKGKMGQGTVPQVKVLEEEGFILKVLPLITLYTDFLKSTANLPH